MEKQRRKQLASLPFSDKSKILEKIRHVSESAGESGMRKRNQQKPVSETQYLKFLSPICTGKLPS